MSNTLKAILWIPSKQKSFGEVTFFWGGEFSKYGLGIFPNSFLPVFLEILLRNVKSWTRPNSDIMYLEPAPVALLSQVSALLSLLSLFAD